MLCRARLSLFVPTLLVASGLIGCGGSPSLPAPVQRLPGKWHGEMIVYKEELEGKLSPERIAALEQMQMDFEFRSDGTMTAVGAHAGQAAASQGQWQMVKQEGDVLMIQSTEEGGRVEPKKFEFDGADMFYMPIQAKLGDSGVADLGAMRFTRLR
jgi:hypothetical protein